VKGANLQDLALLFVAEGIHALELAGPDGALDPGKAARLLAGENASADWLAPSLTW
jgi:hypothetical protein